MLSFESRNPVWGQSTNPYSKNHACGGSSGGEAALLAADGSALGWGSDIGGSEYRSLVLESFGQLLIFTFAFFIGLRIPVGYCGVYAIKPSGGRWPTNGTKACVKNVPKRFVTRHLITYSLLFFAPSQSNERFPRD